MNEPLKKLSKFYKDRVAEAQAESELADKIIDELRNKLPEIKDYYCGCEPSSVEDMVKWYALLRINYTKSAAYYTSRAEEIQLGYFPEAEQFLKHIQYKKLLNLECLWRAGQKKLKGIDTSYDFRLWYYDIFNCPFLQPINQEEVDLMMRFLDETPVELQNSENGIDDYDWGNYVYLKMTYADVHGLELEEFYQTYALAMMWDNGIPPWYDFYDTYMGTEKILMLEDVKFPKELYYIRLYAQHQREKKDKIAKAEGKTPEAPQNRPERLVYIGLDDEYSSELATDDLVAEFETLENKKLWECYKLVEKYGVGYDEGLQEEVQEVFDIMKSLDEKISLEEHEDWRQGLIISYRKYKFRKTAETIPAAYADYLMRIETGVGFAPPDNLAQYSYKDTVNQEILEGRRLAGEPMDFNF